MKLTKNEALEKRNPTAAQLNRAKVDKRIVVKISLLLLSLAGFIDSVYLTIIHYKNIIPPCSLVTGCEKVLTSRFSEFLGIPVALIGSIYFAISIILCVLLLQKKQKKLRKILKIFLILISFGALAAIFFLFVQTFILRAFCQYCLLAEAIIFGIFILSFSSKEKLGK